MRETEYGLRGGVINFVKGFQGHGKRVEKI